MPYIQPGHVLWDQYHLFVAENTATKEIYELLSEKQLMKEIKSIIIGYSVSSIKTTVQLHTLFYLLFS